MVYVILIPYSFLQIFHGDEGKQPTKVNLLTCQLKIVSENKKFFDLVSYNRTYHLHSEDEAEEWISVLLNSKVICSKELRLLEIT